ncbi:MAG: hypothetical protein R8M45_11130 [Ghiorsea sp.]
MKKLKYVVGVLAAVSFSSVVQAEILEYNHASSYTEIGAETISYGEETTVSGNALNMNQTVTNVVQRSGGYTPVGKDFGFYVHSATTLDALPSRESWDISPFGIVQSNDRKVHWNELNILASWRFQDSGYHMVAGASMSTLGFVRSGFNKENGATAFEASLTSPFAVPSGAVTEDSTNIALNMGFRYDSTFVDPDESSRFLAGVLVGTPAYYKVENSNFPGARWISNFQGYDLQANIGYGFKIFEDFMLSTHVEFLYKFRPETGKVAVGTDDTGKTLYGWIPNATIWNLRTVLGLEWSY